MEKKLILKLTPQNAKSMMVEIEKLAEGINLHNIRFLVKKGFTIIICEREEELSLVAFDSQNKIGIKAPKSQGYKGLITSADEWSGTMIEEIYNNKELGDGEQINL